MSRFDPLEALAATRHEFGEHGGVNLSIEASTTFTVMDPSTMPSLFEGVQGPNEGCYLYGRHFNPTVYVLSRQLAALEHTEAAYCTSSGMAAIAGVILQLCDAGDHVVASRSVYGGTFALLKNYLPKKAGLSVSFVDTRDWSSVERAFSPRTKLLYVETMANPTLEVADLPTLAEIAHRHGAKLVVDNTFSPVVITPARHGADVVVASLTKFINGASDIIGGVVCGDARFLAGLMDLNGGSLMLLGPTMDPKAAFHVTLRLPHLGIRMQEHGRRALLFAQRLEALGCRVIYPGLDTHPSHGLLRRLANPGYGFGGVLGIDLVTTERAQRLLSVLQNDCHFGLIAVSLGYFETLLCPPSSTTSSELSKTEQERAGISPGLVRISVGYTGSVEQRWRQLEHALRTVGAPDVQVA
jgi:methionine-gamma-lyase